MKTPVLEPRLSQTTAQHAQRRSQRSQQWATLPGQHHRLVLEYQQIWYRLVLRLLRSEELANPWVLGVTSSIHGEGKTSTSIGLSVALAQETQQRVALIEANSQNPTLADDFGVDDEPGLADYLLGRCPVWAACRGTGIDQLTLVAAGNPPRTARDFTAEGFRERLRRQLPEIVHQIGEEFHYVVLDLPPILGNVDTAEMLNLVHGTILVVRTGVTPLEKFRQAAQLVEGSQLLGVVHLGYQSSVPRWLSQLFSE